MPTNENKCQVSEKGNKKKKDRKKQAQTCVGTDHSNVTSLSDGKCPAENELLSLKMIIASFNLN